MQKRLASVDLTGADFDLSSWPADWRLTADEALAWLLTGACAACGRLTGGAHLSVCVEKTEKKEARCARGWHSNSGVGRGVAAVATSPQCVSC